MNKKDIRRQNVKVAREIASKMKKKRQKNRRKILQHE